MNNENIYYYRIFDDFLKNINNNNNILLYIDNYFNPLDNFNHIIKKKHIHLYCIVSNQNIYNKLSENIKDEENEDNIHIYNNINEMNNVKLNYIISFNILSITHLKIFLESLINIIDNNTMIFIYCNISNETEDIIKYKNIIRTKIQKFIKNNIGYLLSLSETISIIEDLKYNINKILIYKKNHYIIYGDNMIYELSIKLK